MNKGEPFSFLRGTLKQLKKLNYKVNKAIDNFNNDTLYTIDFEDIKQKYLQQLKEYPNHKHLVDIKEFAGNYSYGYHSSKIKNGLDYPESKEAMRIEIEKYLLSLKEKGEI